MKKSNLHLCAAIISLIICIPAFAAKAFAAKSGTRWYQIELILFANNNQSVLASEQWSAEAGLSTIRSMIELTPYTPNSRRTRQASGPDSTTISTNPDTQATPRKEIDQEPLAPFQIISRHDLKLTASARNLERSPRYRLLLHTAWRQPAFNPKDAASVFIYEDLLKPLGSSAPVAYEPSQYQGQFTADAALSTGPRSQHFFGTLKLSLSRYLHISTDIIYRRMVPRPPEPTVIDSEGNIITTDSSSIDEEHDYADPPMSESMLYGFRLKESRRVRPGELHYFDHPLFGMLIKVTRYKRQ